ncbi:sugar ABC transporter permease [Gryllotalpicola daejeonensis]|jgi:multiple sugar transport system permease protein|uniref:Sugar ABC transporter permease n=1 Tax=Gryllotalpicola daejeonensis TaxID=993087 RepID=A0ABP7ZJA1_9MICO
MSSHVVPAPARQAVASPSPARRHSPLKRRISAAGWGFVLPFFIGFILIVVVPVGYAIYLSLFRNQLIGGNHFVGFANYLQAFTDGDFWSGVLRVALFLVVQVPIMLVLALICAFAIDSGRLHGKSFFRIALFLPYAVPGVVAVLMWGFMYNPRAGLTGALGHLLGFTIDPISTQWVLPAIGNIVTWEFLGYNMLIFYAALSTIPRELYEAASIDGAGAFRTIISVKLPALRGSIMIATIFSIIGSFQLFNEPNILRTTALGIIPTNFTPNLYAYTLSFSGNQVNYAATIAIIMGVVTAVVAYVVQLRGMRSNAA